MLPFQRKHIWVLIEMHFSPSNWNAEYIERRDCDWLWVIRRFEILEQLILREIGTNEYSGITIDRWIDVWSSFVGGNAQTNAKWVKQNFIIQCNSLSPPRVMPLSPPFSAVMSGVGILSCCHQLKETAQKIDSTKNEKQKKRIAKWIENVEKQNEHSEHKMYMVECARGTYTRCLHVWTAIARYVDITDEKKRTQKR